MPGSRGLDGDSEARSVLLILVRMKARSIDAVLFDFGGVFTESPFEVARRFGSSLGAQPDRVLEVVFGPYHEDTDHPWHRLERGEIALEIAREEIIALGSAEGLETDPYLVLAALGREGGVREAFVETVRRARAAGMQTAIVTNNVREFREAWRAMLPVEDLFDAVIDSSEVGKRKPDAAIFRHALEAVGGPVAERTVFLDDFAGNVEAARALGMRGILVEPDPAPALAELLAILDANEG
jgi:putative hydrolase of the HAD superfamily